MVAVYLVRHASAGNRSRWEGDQDERPLDELGQQEAVGVGRLLGDRPIVRIVSSPARRCTQTVGPLSRQLGLEVEVDHRLAEGNRGSAATDLFPHDDADVVLCSHGDVIPALLGHLGRTGAITLPGDAAFLTASTWQVDTVSGSAVAATYLGRL